MTCSGCGYNSELFFATCPQCGRGKFVTEKEDLDLWLTDDTDNWESCMLAHTNAAVIHRLANDYKDDPRVRILTRAYVELRRSMQVILDEVNYIKGKS